MILSLLLVLLPCMISWWRGIPMMQIEMQSLKLTLMHYKRIQSSTGSCWLQLYLNIMFLASKVKKNGREVVPLEKKRTHLLEVGNYLDGKYLNIPIPMLFTSAKVQRFWSSTRVWLLMFSSKTNLKSSRSFHPFCSVLVFVFFYLFFWFLMLVQNYQCVSFLPFLVVEDSCYKFFVVIAAFPCYPYISIL